MPSELLYDIQLFRIGKLTLLFVFLGPLTPTVNSLTEFTFRLFKFCLFICLLLAISRTLISQFDRDIRIQLFAISYLRRVSQGCASTKIVVVPFLLQK